MGGTYIMKMPESREDFDDFYILCKDVGSYDLAFKDCGFDGNYGNYVEVE